MSTKPSVLFVCVHNAGRSQMAAAYLTHLAGDRVEVRSAGSAPADSVNPVVVQGVQHIFSPPVELDRWPSQDRDTRLVFITRNIAPETIRNLLSAVTSL